MPGRDQFRKATADPHKDQQAAEDTPALTTASDHHVTMVRIESLVVEGSPRLAGADPHHARLLAETGAELPPIIVHKPTMRVIDGVHRVQAALINGQTVLRARLLDCDEATAFVLAVKANVTHGLPLTQADRQAAAVRIINSHPQWSDRLIAASAGLSDKTVSAIRTRSSAESPHSATTRRGRDGRERPVNPSTKRRHAADLITRNPDAGLREVARATGLSPATVRDVRERIKHHEDPVPAKYLGQPDAAKPGTSCLADVQERPAIRAIARRRAARAGRVSDVDVKVLLTKLSSDPSLKLKEMGRRALHWLRQHVVDPQSCEDVVAAVPDHCAPVVANLARSCAMAWISVAEELEERSAAQ